MSHFILPKEYDGDREEQVIYADMPASKNRLKARFRDVEVNVADLKILNAFEGIYQGDPIYISYHVMENTVISASNTQNMTVKVIYPQWKTFESMPLAPYKYEMMIKHYEPIDDGDDCDWYYLKLIWFDDAPAADQSLEQYINSITSQLDFFGITKKLTYSEKDYWC